MDLSLVVLLSCDPSDPSSADLPLLRVSRGTESPRPLNLFRKEDEASPREGPVSSPWAINSLISSAVAPALIISRISFLAAQAATAARPSVLLSLNFLKELSRGGTSSSRFDLLRLEDSSRLLRVQGGSDDSAFLCGLPRSWPSPRTHAGLISLPPAD